MSPLASVRAVAALALLVLALAAPPSRAEDDPVPDAAPGFRPHLGVLVGAERLGMAVDDSGDPGYTTGIAFRADAELRSRRVTPAVGVSFVASLGYSRFDADVFGPDAAYEGDWARLETSLRLVSLRSGARFTFGHSRLHPYVDAVFGIHWASMEQTSTYVTYVTFPRRTADEQLGLSMGLAAGVRLQLAPTFSLGGELAVTSPHAPIASGTYADELVGGFGVSALLAARFAL